MTMPDTSPTDAPLTISLFGSMRVQVQGRPIARLRTHKILWLLALLAMRGGRAVEREWLAGTLWPEADQSRASANLRPVLTLLRDALGEEGKRLQSPSRHTVLLDIAGAEVDLRDFDQEIKRGDLPALRRAVDLYRGPLLEGVGEDWVFPEREARERDCLRALQRLAEAAHTAGDSVEATSYWRRAVSRDPLWDAARRGLMEALAEAGDSNAALQIYREFVATLQGNGDRRAVPDEETTALYQRLRTEARRRATASAAPKAGIAEAAPPRIFGELPHALNELIGREEERLEVAEALRHSRLVTLTGPGGIGKTRLARAVAEEAAREYPEGVGMVSLEAISDPDLVSRAVAGALRVKETADKPLLQTLAAFLAGKRLLLVLDNCEHLLDAVAHLAAHLLRECPDMRVLATSREAVRIIGETVWPVPALAVPDPGVVTTIPQALAEFEGVRLFVERARAVQKTFLLTGENAQTVSRLCTRLEGVPLAIELAAARVRSITVEQIIGRLEDPLPLPVGAGGRTEVPARQQTLRAALDWSYNLLDDSERLLLRRLSVFRGGWRLEAAEQVCAEEDSSRELILDRLISLVDKSLVVFEEREAEPGGRYRLLEMIRQYAAERLAESGEEPEIRTAHRRYLYTLADEADMGLDGPEQEQWLRCLDAEHDNLRAALTWDAPDVAGEEESLLSIAGALWRFWEIRGHHSEGRQHLQRILDRPDAQAETQTRARALTGAGALAMIQGDIVAARERHRQSLSIYRKSGNPQAIASALANQGIATWHLGDLAGARALLEEALGIQREWNDLINVPKTLASLGNLVRSLGDHPVARGYFQESLNLGRQRDDQRVVAYALEGLGGIALLEGEYAAAQTHLEEGLHLRRQLGDRYGVALSLGNLAGVANERGEIDRAHRLYEECLALFREFEDRHGTAHTLVHLGMMAHERGDAPESVEELLEEGLALLRQAGEQEGIAFALRSLGRVVADHGDPVQGQTLLRESLSLDSAAGNRLGVAESLESLAAVLLAQGRTRQAVRLWGTMHTLREALSTPLSVREQQSYERLLAHAQGELGESQFAAAWEEGRALPWEQAVAHALKEPDGTGISDP